MVEPIVKRVDRLVVRVHSPEPLFSTLTEQLMMPVAWLPETNPLFTSAGIHLGNLNLEIMQVSRQARPARLYGIAFELLPFDTSLPELDERGIPHTPPAPFYAIDEQGWQVTTWNNVYLGGLLGENPAAKAFFSLSQRASPATLEKASFPRPFVRRFGLPFMYDTVYRHGMIFAVEYSPAWRAAHIKEVNTHAGLDVTRVYEITIGVQQYERAYGCWNALLTPYREVRRGIWKLPDGLHLRLAQRPTTGLRRVILQVASLNRAAQFLYKHGLLGKERSGMVTIDPAKVSGLDIRLVQ